MPKTTPSGVPPDERIAPIDILRGIALFGVMAVNVVTAFRVSMFQQFLPGFEPASFPDRVAGVFVSQVLELKAFALFSLLFGIGLGIQFERLSRGGQPFYWLARRLAVLLVFGLIHLLFIWNGDILTEYALAGLIVLPFLRGPKWLVGWLAFGVLYFYVVMPLMGLKIWWPDTGTFQRAVDEANRVYATGGFGDIWRLSLAELPLWLPLHEYIFPRTVGLFLLGAFAWRSGMFKDLGRFKSQLAIGAVVGIGVGGALTTMQGAGGRIATVVLALGYHAWRGDKGTGDYADVSGFCKAAKLDEIRKHGYMLTPGRYVGAQAAEDDDEPFEEKMQRFSATLRDQQAVAAKLDVAITANLKELGYGG